MFISPTQKIQDRIMVSSVAHRYGVSVPTLYRWMSIGKFPSPMRSGGRIFWTDEQLEKFDKQEQQDAS